MNVTRTAQVALLFALGVGLAAGGCGQGQQDEKKREATSSPTNSTPEVVRPSGPSSEEVVNLLEKGKWKEPTVVSFGKVLVSGGEKNVPKGTPIYPILLTLPTSWLIRDKETLKDESKRVDVEGVAYFFRDEFGRWDYYWKQRPDLSDPRFVPMPRIQ